MHLSLLISGDYKLLVVQLSSAEKPAKERNSFTESSQIKIQ